MELEFLKCGNSATIRINRALLKQIKAVIGVSLAAEVRNGGLYLKPATEPRYSLDDLLTSCTKAKMRLDNEDRAWLFDAPGGRKDDR